MHAPNSALAKGSLGQNRAGTDLLQLGTSILPTGICYSLWAPEHKKCCLLVKGPSGGTRSILMSRDGDYFLAKDVEGVPGDRYTFRLDDGPELADFASRFQPEGIDGPSMVVDPSAYAWKNVSWQTPPWKGQIVYEMHVGTFTPEGTYLAAIEKLGHIHSLGATAIEVMPLAERAGGRNWGYDGVFLFAPTHTYGTPDQLRAFVDAAHGHGLSVILDVVFNHLGPQGNVGPHFSPYYFHSGTDTPWGQNFDLDGPESAYVRSFLKQNVLFWLDEFRIDGFRMDATHAIPDRSPRHLLAELAELVHDHGGSIIAEDERNASTILEISEGSGWNFDAAWADDFHHGIRVSQNPSRERYYEAFTGTAAEIAETIEHGWLYRGRKMPSTGHIRGTECRHLQPEKFIYCISNHDQIGNRPFADRFHHAISAQAYRAVSLFFCLLPYTPMIFMGQEWGASTPFHFFTDFKGELGQKMAEYRLQEFDRLGLSVPPGRVHELVDPQSEEAFINSKLNWPEIQKEPHCEILSFYRASLALRKQLQVDGNTDRTNWKVRAEGNVVILTYFFPDRTVAVHFAVKDNTDLRLPNGKCLARAGNGVAGEPETVVIEELA